MDPKRITQFVDYDPSIGSLTWRIRTADLVPWSAKKRDAWNAKYAGKPALTALRTYGYKGGKIMNQLYLAHRVAWAAAHGEWPDHIDHINGNPADNRLENLRSVRPGDNMRNRKVPANTATGVLGVRKESKTTYVATIGHQGKSIVLGRFKEFEDAVAARKEAEIRYGYHNNHGNR
jgi:hypothetical protein